MGLSIQKDQISLEEKQSKVVRSNAATLPGAGSLE